MPFWRQTGNIKVYVAAIILNIAWIVSLQIGKDHPAIIVGYALAIIIGGYTLFKAGFQNLLKFEFDMKTLMTIAIIGAAIIGEWGEGAMVVILFAISEALESYSMDKARQSIASLMAISPKQALIQRGNSEALVAVDDIQVGDIMIVKPGEKLAMDGVVLAGQSAINQAAITGESIPVAKKVEDEVYAGTLNETGLLKILVTKRAEDSTLAHIIYLVEEAQAEKAPSQAFVDNFAQYYTPAIMVIALLIAVIPPLFLGGEWLAWIYQGLAVLVVGCPCALVVSTPVAVVTAIGNAAQHGVLVKGGVYLEEAGAIQGIAFDKTGTLTEGVPRVTAVLTDQEDEAAIIKIAAIIEKGSQHPLAQALIKTAEERQLDIETAEVANFNSLTGQGVTGEVNGERYYIGNQALFDMLKLTLHADWQQQMAAWQKQGHTVVIMGTAAEILAVIAVADRVRANAQQVMQSLNDKGIATIMLTGDNPQTAQAIGAQIGVTDIAAELMPADKLAIIKQRQANGAKLAMVGDGVNDAPALAAATVGIAMGGAGTDTALETADIVLMADDLSKVEYTIELSRKTLQIIKQNITFALALKAIALLLVIPGWLTLWIAIFADMGATLIVTLNSLRLLQVK